MDSFYVFKMNLFIILLSTDIFLFGKWCKVPHMGSESLFYLLIFHDIYDYSQSYSSTTVSAGSWKFSVLYVR